MPSTTKLLRSGQGNQNWLGGLGIRVMVSSEESKGGFTMIEHRLKPHALAAPMHRHTHEDEYSYIVHGRVGAKLGEEIVYAETGDVVSKPRGQWHTFWNTGDEEARLLEIISPAGFEHYFEEMVNISGGGRPDPALAAPIRQRHGLEVDPSSIAKLVAEHKINFG